MIAFVRKNLAFSILKHTSPVCGGSPVSFSFSLRLFSSVTETQLSISHFPPELASRVASGLTHLKNPEKAVSILSFFKESGFSNAQLIKIVKRKPRFLSASLEDSIKPKIKIFQDLGLSSDEICKIVSGNPAILQMSLKHNIICSLSVLKGLLGSNNEVAAIIKNLPMILSADSENTIMANVEFLKSCGIPMERIRIILRAYPNCFRLKPQVIMKCAEKAEEMGLRKSSTNFIYAIAALASMSNKAWDLKLGALRNLGFSDGDISTMFRKAPLAFNVSMGKINKIKELLFATGKFDFSSIVNCPMSLKSSIEKRYIPRLKILGTLESRNLIQEWPALGTISVLPDHKFVKRFVKPYLNEIGDVYITESSAQGKKKTKP